MKKVVFLGLCFAGALQALPLVNPADSVMYTNGIFWHDGDRSSDWPCTDDCWLDSFSMRFGFYGDYVFNRNLKINYATVNSQWGSWEDGGNFIKTALSTNAGTVCINFRDWIEAYAAFGVSTIFWELNTNDITGSGDFWADVAFSPSVSYTVGATAPIFHKGGFVLGVQAQYFYLKESKGQGVRWCQLFQLIHYDNAQPKYVEYQGAVAASYNFESEYLSFIPFVGIQFSGVDWNLTKLDDLYSDLTVFRFPRARQQKVVGWTLGNSIILCNRGGVTAEARFANEKALHVSGQLVF